MVTPRARAHGGGLLLVEDDPGVRESLCELLTEEGYRVVTARDGQEALGLLSPDTPPCLILLDLMMPVMDGWTFSQHLRADARFAGVPLVLLSGVPDLEASVQTLGAVAGCPKPLDLPAFLALVADYC